MMRLAQRSLAVIVLAAALSIASFSTQAGGGPPAILDPKTYTSPSGDYELRVASSDIRGRGEGAFVLTKSGVPVWLGDNPYPLGEAGVTETAAASGSRYYWLA
jgi:hypothetical protein